MNERNTSFVGAAAPMSRERLRVSLRSACPHVAVAVGPMSRERLPVDLHIAKAIARISAERFPASCQSDSPHFARAIIRILPEKLPASRQNHCPHLWAESCVLPFVLHRPRCPYEDKVRRIGGHIWLGNIRNLRQKTQSTLSHPSTYPY